MKRTVLFLGLGLALAAARPTPAAAQTRITVAVGLGVPRPFLSGVVVVGRPPRPFAYYPAPAVIVVPAPRRSEEHTSELQSRLHLVCRLLLEKKKKSINYARSGKNECDE